MMHFKFFFFSKILSSHFFFFQKAIALLKHNFYKTSFAHGWQFKPEDQPSKIQLRLKHNMAFINFVSTYFLFMKY